MDLRWYVHITPSLALIRGVVNVCSGSMLPPRNASTFPKYIGSDVAVHTSVLERPSWVSSPLICQIVSGFICQILCALSAKSFRTLSAKSFGLDVICQTHHTVSEETSYYSCLFIFYSSRVRHIDVPAPADCGPLRGTPGYHLPQFFEILPLFAHSISLLNWKW